MNYLTRRVMLAVFLLFGLASLAAADEPHWLWSRPKGQAKGGEVVFFRKAFQLDGPVKKAELFASCDNRMDVYLNGTVVTQSSEWQRPTLADLSKHVRTGANILAVRGQNDGGNLAGFMARLTLSLTDGEQQEILTDPSWRFTDKLEEGWQTAEFDDSKWVAPVSQGRFGVEPWGRLVGGRLGPQAGAPSKPGEATPVEQITVAPGFHVELLYSVPKATYGSWVAITNDTRGRLIVSDQGKVRPFRKGLNETPWNIPGVDAGKTVWATFRKENLRPAVEINGLKPGLEYEYFQADWPTLFTYVGISGVLDPETQGTVRSLLDPQETEALRQTDRAYAIRYAGYLNVPSNGVYSFYAPEHFYTTTMDTGYDLRVFIGGEEWFPTPDLHSENVWHIPLERGPHRLTVAYTDYRWQQFRDEYWMSWQPRQMWQGSPVLEVSGPGTGRQPVPASWLEH